MQKRMQKRHSNHNNCACNAINDFPMEPPYKARAFLRRGRQPEEKISDARTILISNEDNILGNVNMVV